MSEEKCQPEREVTELAPGKLMIPMDCSECSGLGATSKFQWRGFCHVRRRCPICEGAGRVKGLVEIPHGALYLPAA